jgi:peptidyl-tRNA hydrolase, PTH1 family
MFVVIGLGNPGKQYQYHRHNIGFLCLDYLGSKYGNSTTFKASGLAQITKATINDHAVILAKPQTFMNLSGQAVMELKQFYKVSNHEVLVIHDDIDLKFGEVRHKFDGGSAGHNGLKDISEAIASDYHRIRIGIDHPRRLGLAHDVSNYVLSDFDAEEQAGLAEIFGQCEERLSAVLEGKIR